MSKEPKFNIGDEVYVIENKAPKIINSVYIEARKIEITKTKIEEIHFTGREIMYQLENYQNGRVFEHKIVAVNDDKGLIRLIEWAFS